MKTQKPKLEPIVYRIPQACQLLNTSRTGLYALINKGVIKKIKLGGLSLIPASEIKRVSSA